MGRKSNNLPARLARKKKIKDKNNLQIQGRAGLGRRREKGRSERQKQRQKPNKVDAAEPKKAQLGYVELAKQQEQKAEAQANQAKQAPVVQAAPKGKKARKKRKRSPEVLRSEGTWERSHVIPKADLNRDDTVNFGEDRQIPEPNTGEEGRLPKAAAIALAPGMVVRICGLEKVPALNGMMGTLNTWNASTERWSVLIDGHLKLLKKENL